MTDPTPPTILVVDDEEDHRGLFKLALETSGYRVYEATNGIHAVQLAEEIQPALILMDLSLPLLDGKHAAEQIRQHPSLRGVPIIFVTAFGQLGMDLYSTVDSLGDGPIEYLTKPSDFCQLGELVRDMLNKV